MSNTESTGAHNVSGEESSAGIRYTTSSSAQAREEVAGEQRRTIGELVAAMTAQLSSLVRDEMTYTKKALTHKVKNLGIAGVLLAGAGVLALYLLLFVLLGLSALFAALCGNNWWAGFFITAGILLVIVAILAAIGFVKFKKSGKYKANPVGGVAKGVDAIKKGISK
ncbi:hypothetical protein ACU19_05670 [Actinobaculum suis]|uniref:phage holin family protein n=1 Tax=Actinobaculum suis TaxID=1657 RepID=UPI00066FBBFB|nr:phage holin family protein [Actinobaculum suis]KMY23226.1 hypothetical protein ACU19_05670 [Actinobaculum suis]